MAIEIRGSLLQPDNTGASNIEILITAAETNGNVIKGLQATVLADDEGAYDFSLLPGVYSVQVVQQYTRTALQAGTINVTDVTQSPSSLSELLLSSQ